VRAVGTPETDSGRHSWHFSRPDGTEIILRADPALKRRATISRPYGDAPLNYSFFIASINWKSWVRSTTSTKGLPWVLLLTT